jgi:hypothetical protein
MCFYLGLVSHVSQKQPESLVDYEHTVLGKEERERGKQHKDKCQRGY